VALCTDLRNAIIVALPNAPSPERKAAAIIAEEIESAALINRSKAAEAAQFPRFYLVRMPSRGN
jgi:hypothetical protein